MPTPSITILTEVDNAVSSNGDIRPTAVDNNGKEKNVISSKDGTRI